MAGYRLAESTLNNRLYAKYGPAQYFPEVLGDDDDGTVTLPSTYKNYDIQYLDSQGRVIHRQEAGPSQYLSETHASANHAVDKISLNTIRGRKWQVLFGRPRTDDDWLGNADYYGTPLISADDPLNWQHTKNVYLPKGKRIVNVIAIDQNRTMAFRHLIFDDKDGWLPKTLEFNSSESVPFVMTNREDDSVFDIFVYRYPKGKKDTKSSHPPALDIFPLLEKISLMNGESITLNLEPGHYHFKAVTIDKEIDGYMEVSAMSNKWEIIDCPLPGKVRNGTKTWPLKRPKNQQQVTDQGTFVEYTASGTPVPGMLAIDLCTKKGAGQGKEEWTIGGGEVLIDPDGYVYDAVQGIEAVIEGATVTCDMYDEDMQSWARWPAELYESQINPQVTGGDGYYAFFVPPGLYRVRAEAADYLSHISPDIRVISEIVHYNVPLDSGTGNSIHLPLLVR